jgi:hypothetical protein
MVGGATLPPLLSQHEQRAQSTPYERKRNIVGKYDTIQADMKDQYPQPEQYPQDLDSFQHDIYQGQEDLLY